MKRLIIFIIIAFSFINHLSGQDKEPEQVKFYINNDYVSNDSTYLKSDTLWFEQNKFLLGWQWSDGEFMTKALRMNQTHTYPFKDSANVAKIPDNTNLILHTSNIWTTASSKTPMMSMAMYFEPTLRITQPGTFLTRDNDPSNSVFGFETINGTILTNSQDQNYNRLILYKDSLINYPDSIVLKSIWPNGYIKYRTGISQVSNNDANSEYMDLSINLRRLDSIDLFPGTDTILSLRIEAVQNFYYYIDSSKQYEKYDDSSVSIIFNGLPNPDHDSTFQLPNGRGKIRKMIDSADSVVYITRDMLPVRDGGSDIPDITINSQFFCDARYNELDTGDVDKKNNSNNYVLEPATARSGVDDTLHPINARTDIRDIEIKYYGNCNIAIDWVRIGTLWAKDLFEGKHDDLIIANVQHDIENTSSPEHISRGIKPFRFYLRDEGGLEDWAAFRYFNKLVGNVGTAEDTPPYPKHYYYYVNPPERWIGLKYITPKDAVPYFRQGNETNDFSMHFKYGYTKGNSSRDPGDSVKSGYETFLLGSPSLKDMRETMSEDSFYIYIKGSGSYQAWLETYIYDFYKNEKLVPVFSDDKWWGELWIGNNWTWRNKYIIYPQTWCSEIRPKTGEEIRQMASLPLIFGTKGLLYDKEQSYKFTQENASPQLGISWHKNRFDTLGITTYSDTLIFRDDIGSDFVNLNDSLDWTEIEKYIYFDDTTSKVLGFDLDRLYLGRKSVRLELRKLHQWINSVSDTLMKLKLVSWYSKGYKIWQETHPDYNQSILDSLLDFDYFKTRPIDRVKPIPPEQCINPIGFGNCYEPHYEPLDSMFYMITLLKDTSETMNDVFYLGVLNRRTDPLINFEDSLNIFSDCDTCQSMKFFATAELEDSCKKGIYSDYWQSLWWKRLGCREFRLPFDYKNSLDSNEFCLLHIRELGAGIDSLDNMDWRDKKYYHLIDTVIGQDKDAVVRLLPGEGKLLQITVLHPPKNINGYLSHSNQNKLVVHPVLRADGTENDSIVRYHVVYHKPIYEGSDTMGVFYNRSRPVYINSPYSNIVWEDSILLSKNIDLTCLYGSGDIPKLSCDHPSIVVRKSGNNLRAYVVYSCDQISTTHPLGNIVESILDVNYPDIASIVSTKVIGDFSGRGIDSNVINREWGTPVINASAGGNFYAWSDSTNFISQTASGIVIAWKNTSSDCIELHRKIYSNILYPYNYLSKFPSLNSYSNIDSGEINCTLAWLYQNISGNDEYKKNSITHIYKIQDSLTISAKYIDGNHNNFILFNQDSSVYHLNLNLLFKSNNAEFKVISCQKPYVFRNFVSRNNQNNFKEVDIISYPFTTGYIGPPLFLYSSYPWSNLITFGLGIKDSLSYENIDYKNIITTWNLYSYNKLLSNPSLSQPESFYQGGRYILNFTETVKNDTNGIDVKTIEYSHPFWNSGRLKEYGSTQTQFFNYLYQGDYSELAIYPKILPRNENWKNRRVYNNNVSNVPDILSSSKYFYRTNDDEIISDDLFGYCNTYHFYFTNPKVGGEYLKLNLPYEEILDSVNGNFYLPLDKDTIYSDWFSVAPMTSTDIEFKCFGVSSALITLGLESLPSGTFINLTLPPLTPPDAGIVRIYTIANMLDANYRLVYINHDTNAIYNEMIYLHGLPPIDTLFAKQGEISRIFIDFNTGKTIIMTESGKMELKVFPNPAKDEVFVTVNYPVKYLLENSDRINKAKIKFYSITGEKLFEYLARPGETIKIPTSEYTQGLYFIQAEENIDKWQLDYLAPAFERVMIER